MGGSLDIWTYRLLDWGNLQGLVSHDLKDPIPLIFLNFRLRIINYRATDYVINEYNRYIALVEFRTFVRLLVFLKITFLLYTLCLKWGPLCQCHSAQWLCSVQRVLWTCSLWLVLNVKRQWRRTLQRWRQTQPSGPHVLSKFSTTSAMSRSLLDSWEKTSERTKWPDSLTTTSTANASVDFLTYWRLDLVWNTVAETLNSVVVFKKFTIIFYHVSSINSTSI